MTRGAVPIVAVLAAALGASLTGALGLPSLSGAVLSVAVVVEVAVARSATARIPVDLSLRGWRRIELVVLGVAAPLLMMVTGATGAGGRLVDRSVVVGWILAGAMWLLSHATLRDVESLGTPWDDPGVWGGPLGRLRGRLMWSGGLIVVLGLLEGLRLEQLTDLRREALGTVVGPALVFFTLGLIGVSRAAYRHEEGRWHRDRTTVEVGVDRRWKTAALVMVAAGTLVGFALPNGSTLVAEVPRTAVGMLGGAGVRIADWFANVGSRDSGPSITDGGPRVGLSPNLSSRPDPGWFAEFMNRASVWILLAFFVGFAMIMSARAGERGEPRSRAAPVWGLVVSVARGLAGLGRAVMWWLVSVVRRLRRGLRLGIGRPTPGPSGGHGTSGWIWVPDDPVRLAIADRYRAFVELAGRRFGRLQPAETAGEFGRRVRVETPDSQAVAELTGLFEEARYSAHPLGASSVDAAERYGERIERALGFGGHPEQ